MEITVCIKQVPGSNQVEVDKKTGVIKRDGAKSKLNPYDLFAVEEALKIAEMAKDEDVKVRSVTMGPPQAMEAVKETLWMGLSGGVLISDRKFGGSDVFATSEVLAAGIKAMGHFDLIVCGKQTTDGDTAQVGPELAEKLGIEHVSNVTEICEITSGDITVVADFDTHIKTLKIELPCLITVEKDANTPRLPSYKRRKEIEGKEDIKVLTAEDLTELNQEKIGLKGSPTHVEKIFPPEKKNDKLMYEGSAEELSEIIYEALKQDKTI